MQILLSERDFKMLKFLKLSGIIFIAVMSIFALSFSVLQACVHQYAKIIEVTCDVCDSSGIVDTTEDVVLNIKGMTCAGCEGKVKKLCPHTGVSAMST
jgi:hypothetical protein